MKKSIKGFSAVLLFVLAVSFNILKADASSSATITISGGGSYNVGDTVSISVKLEGSEEIGFVKMRLSGYSSILESENGSEIIIYDDAITSRTGKYTYTFKAKTAGTVNVSVTPIEIYRLNFVEGEGDDMSVAAASTTVTVAAPKTASANNSLKSLQISPGTLTPAFASGTLKYTATVPNSTTKISVSATAADSTAKVTSVTGNTNLAVGKNNIKVVVTAENGATATYTIVVTREAAAAAKTEEEKETTTVEETEEETTEEEAEQAIEVAVGNDLLYVYNEFPDSSIPAGFEKATVIYNGSEIAAVKSSVGELVLVYLVDENEENGAFYVYDEESGGFSAFVEATGTATRYFIIVPGSGVEIPAGYTETTLKIGEQTVKAWQTDAEEMKDFYLIYVMNSEGEKGFYMYDSAEGTFQRHIVLEDSEDAAVSAGDAETLEKQIGELNDKYTSDLNARLRGFSILAVVAFLSMLTNVNLLLKMRNMKQDYENPEADEAEEDEETIEFEPYESLEETDEGEIQEQEGDALHQEENEPAEDAVYVELNAGMETDQNADAEEDLEEAYQDEMPDTEAGLNNFIAKEMGKEDLDQEEASPVETYSENADAEEVVQDAAAAEDENVKHEKGRSLKDKLMSGKKNKKTEQEEAEAEEDDFSLEFVDLDKDN